MNDAKYFYVLADGKLKIVDAWPAAQIHTVGTLAIEGTPRKLFVQNDRAVIYSSLSGSVSTLCSSPPLAMFGMILSRMSSEATPG